MTIENVTAPATSEPEVTEPVAPTDTPSVEPKE